MHETGGQAYATCQRARGGVGTKNNRHNSAPPNPSQDVAEMWFVLCVVRVRLTEQNQYYDRVENVC